MAERKKTTKKPSSTQPINDVAAPGQTAPSATSTPVIITNHNLVADPMMLSQVAPKTKPSAPLLQTTTKSPLQPLKAPIPDMFDVDKQPTASKSKPVAKAKIIKPPKTVTITPVGQPVPQPPAATVMMTTTKSAPTHAGLTLQPLTPPPAIKVEFPATDDKKVEQLTTAEPLAEPPKPAATKPLPVMQDVVTMPADKPIEALTTISNDESSKIGRADSQRDQEVAEENKQQQTAKLQKLVEAKTYFLPIDSLEKRRTKRFVGLGTLLSLLLIIAWADIALDAGLIHLSNIKPVTHFFNQSSQPVAPAAVPVVAKAQPKAATALSSTGSCAPYTVTDANFSKSPFTGCFDQHFASCSAAQITITNNSSFAKGEVDKYAIQSKQGAACLVQWQYVIQPANTKLNGLTISCPYDPTKEFEAALTANNNFTGCSGPLLNALSASSDSSSANGSTTVISSGPETETSSQ